MRTDPEWDDPQCCHLHLSDSTLLEYIHGKSSALCGWLKSRKIVQRRFYDSWDRLLWMSIARICVSDAASSKQWFRELVEASISSLKDKSVLRTPFSKKRCASNTCNKYISTWCVFFSRIGNEMWVHLTSSRYFAAFRNAWQAVPLFEHADRPSSGGRRIVAGSDQENASRGRYLQCEKGACALRCWCEEHPQSFV